MSKSQTQTAPADAGQPSGDAAANAPTASGASLPNATPQMIAADEFDAAWRGEESTIRAGLREIDTIVAGDVSGAAYIKAKAALKGLQVPLSTMVLWYPGSGDDPIEKRVIAAHNELQPETSVAAYDLLSRIMKTAVAASDPAVATDARVGASKDSTKPQFKYVQSRVLVDKSVPADKRPNGAYVGSQTDAKAEFDAEIAAANKSGDVDSEQAWKLGKDAVDSVVNLRRLGNELAALGMRRNRWRRVLYVNVAQQYLDQYKDSNPVTPVGKVWSDALAKAAQAHKAYVNEHGPKSTATTEGLQSAIAKAVWDDFLALKVEVQGKKQKSEDEVRKALVKALWKALDDVDKEFTAQCASQVEKYLDTMAQFVPDTAEALKRPSRKASEQRQREEQEAEARAKSDAAEEGAADDKAHADAAEQRQQARAQQRDAAQPAAPTPRSGNAPAPRTSSRASRVARPA